TAGSHVITATYGGDPTFAASAGSHTQRVSRAVTTVAVDASTNPSGFGQPVTFTATVSPAAPGGGTPTRTVTFTGDGASRLTVTLSGAQATFTTATLAIGPHTVTVQYSGDTNFNSSTSPVLMQTVKVATTTTLVSSLNPSSVGQPVTFTATVSATPPGGGTPTGTVTFTVDGGSPVAVTLSGVQATFTTSTLTQGTHTITVV